jgi:excisionase family DNA binding protein
MSEREVAELAARTGLQPMLTIDELAALAHQSRRTIERRIAEGRIEVKRYSARCVRIPRDAAAAYLAAERAATVLPPPSIHSP